MLQVLKEQGYAIIDNDIEDYLSVSGDDKRINVTKNDQALPIALSGRNVIYRSLSINRVENAESDFGSDMRELEKVLRWPQPIFPNIRTGKYLSVVLTHVDEIGQMYVHLSENSGKMRQIQDFFKAFYGDPEDEFDVCENVETSKSNWEVNEECIGLYERKHWCRARVVKIEGTSAIIFFVDFGHAYKIDDIAKELRIPYHFGNVPTLCFRIVMDNIVPLDINKGWEEETIYLLHNYLYSKDSGKILIQSTRNVTHFPIPVEIKVPAKNGRKMDVGKLIVEEFMQGRYGSLNYENDEYSKIAYYIV